MIKTVRLNFYKTKLEYNKIGFTLASTLLITGERFLAVGSIVIGSIAI
jgi:hypothetical protein